MDNPVLIISYFKLLCIIFFLNSIIFILISLIFFDLTEYLENRVKNVFFFKYH